MVSPCTYKRGSKQRNDAILSKVRADSFTMGLYVVFPALNVLPFFICGLCGLFLKFTCCLPCCFVGFAGYFWNSYVVFPFLWALRAIFEIHMLFALLLMFALLWGLQAGYFWNSFDVCPAVLWALKAIFEIRMLFALPLTFALFVGRAGCKLFWFVIPHASNVCPFCGLCGGAIFEIHVVCPAVDVCLFWGPCGL